jgi:hypothetical protein
MLENDFLICVELFSRAIDTYPDNSDRDQVNEKISWGTINCDILNLDITNNDQAKVYIGLAKHYGLAAPNVIFGLDTTSVDLYRDLNRQLPKELLSSPLYKAGVTYLILMSEGDIAGCYGGLLFQLSFALSRTANFRSQSWGRRFTVVQRQLLAGNMLLNSLSEGSAREMSTLIDTKVRDGLDPEILSLEISSIVNQSFSHVPQLIAVTGQVEYKGLAPIQLIGRAMAERSEVPWDMLFDRFPILAEELTSTSRYISDIGSDVHAGIKFGGVSQDIKNLLYFCVRSLIILGGEESLRNYAGFGGDNSQSAVPMKITLDALIDRLKERQIKMAAEIDVDTTDAPVSQLHQENVEKIIRFAKSRGENKPPDGPDDDDDNPPPGPSGSITATTLPEQGMDTTDYSGSEIHSPDQDDDEIESVRSSQSGTKRRAFTRESPPHSSKRTTRAHVEAMIWPSSPVDGQGKVSVMSCIQTLNR